MQNQILIPLWEKVIMLFTLNDSNSPSLFIDNKMLEGVYLDVKHLFDTNGYPTKGSVLLQVKFDLKNILSNTINTAEHLACIKSKISELDETCQTLISTATSGGVLIAESKQYLNEIRMEYTEAVMSDNEGKIGECEGIINKVERKIDRRKIKIKGGKKTLNLIQKQLVCLRQIFSHIHHQMKTEEYNDSNKSYQKSVAQFAEVFGNHWQKREACGYVGLSDRSEARQRLFANLLEVIGQKIKK